MSAFLCSAKYPKKKACIGRASSRGTVSYHYVLASSPVSIAHNNNERDHSSLLLTTISLHATAPTYSQLIVLLRSPTTAKQQ